MIMAEKVGTLIVTGASRGIGAAISVLAAAQGYAVAVNFSSDEAGAASVVKAISDAGCRALAVQGDIAEENEVTRLFETAGRELGAVTGLVNNAGITGHLSRVEDMSPADIARVFAINVTGSFLCAREAVRRMSTKRGGQGGAIVNLSSRAAQVGGAGEWVHYAASKGAIDTFTIGLAREVADEGIRVNAVSPGLIETGIHAAAGDGARLERMAPLLPMRRVGAAREVASAVVWLLSAEASYITGAIVPVSGGR
jgi:NAD(P)-dependent dehydrogenase (short-subunit alcohol dehydrogenase family)